MMTRTTTTTTLRLSRSEREALDRAASGVGLGPSAFARLAVVKAAGAKPTPARKRRTDLAKAISGLLGELGAIGNNLNQLARHANRGGVAAADELSALRSELERITLATMRLRE